MTLEEQITQNPAAFASRIDDIRISDWLVENETIVFCDCHGTEYFGGDWMVDSAEVWIDEEIVSVNRTTLCALIGADRLEEIEASETEDNR